MARGEQVITAAEMDALLLEIANDKSWHWKLKRGLFQHREEVYETRHVSQIIVALEKDTSSESQRYLPSSTIRHNIYKY